MILSFIEILLRFPKNDFCFFCNKFFLFRGIGNSILKWSRLRCYSGWEIEKNSNVIRTLLTTYTHFSKYYFVIHSKFLSKMISCRATLSDNSKKILHLYTAFYIIYILRSTTFKRFIKKNYRLKSLLQTTFYITFLIFYFLFVWIVTK